MQTFTKGNNKVQVRILGKIVGAATSVENTDDLNGALGEQYEKVLLTDGTQYDWLAVDYTRGLIGFGKDLEGWSDDKAVSLVEWLSGLPF